LKNIPATDPMFAKVTEELGGYRQISKSIPLLQQFTKAEYARQIALSSAGDLERDAIRRQESMLNAFTKLREELAVLIRSFTNDTAIKSFIFTFLQGATALTKFADV